MALEGITLTIAGRFRGVTQAQIRDQLEALGAIVVDRLDERVDMLVVGGYPGKKEEQARELDITIVSFEALQAQLGTIEDDDPSGAFMAQMRSLLSQTPSKANWQFLCNIFDRWPAEELDIALGYAFDHLANWKAELCLTPNRWLQDLSKGNPNPRISLLRHLIYQSHNLDFPSYESNDEKYQNPHPLKNKGLQTLIASGVSQLEYISLPSQEIGDQGMRTLADCEELTNLRELHLIDNTYSNKMVTRLLRAPWLPQLEALSLQSPRLTGDGLARLRNAPELQHIKRLVLQPSLHGTKWTGEDTDGDNYELYFHKDGHLSYSTNGGNWDDVKDQWRQHGTKMVISMTNGYAMYEGEIQGDQIKGHSHNVANHKWSWSFYIDGDDADTLERGWGWKEE